MTKIYLCNKADLIGNQAPGQFIIWSIVSVVVLIAGIGVFLFVYLTQEETDEVQPVPARPAVRIPTPSQKVVVLQKFPQTLLVGL